MGRPIQKKNFGNTNYPYDNDTTGGFTGLGGEGVASVAISNSGTNYSVGTVGAFSAPNIAGGVQALATLEIIGTGALRGKIMSVTVTEPGTGYTAAPTFTLTTATAVTSATTGTNGATRLYPAAVTGIVVGMLAVGANVGTSSYVTAVGANYVDVSATNANTVNTSTKYQDNGIGFANTVAATSSKVDAITITSYLTTGSSAVSGGDIMKQVGSRRYKVRNSQGVGVCTLSTGTGTGHVLSPGFMHITGADWGGATYYFDKINANTGRVWNRTSTSTAYYTDGELAKWTIGAATGTDATAVISISHTI
jgi:hypothetical protein